MVTAKFHKCAGVPSQLSGFSGRFGRSANDTNKYSDLAETKAEIKKVMTRERGAASDPAAGGRRTSAWGRKALIVKRNLLQIYRRIR